jgi:hypothetical protein
MGRVAKKEYITKLGCEKILLEEGHIRRRRTTWRYIASSHRKCYLSQEMLHLNSKILI